MADVGLTTVEQTELERYETIIDGGLQTFIEVGNALMAIRDARLYRETHRTFEDYCRERWGMQRAHAYRLMDGAQVVTNLSPVGDIPPVAERHIRPLTKLEPAQQREAWQKAVDTAPNGKVTAAHVETVVQGYVPQPLESHQLINRSTNNEWYTPKPYIEAARAVMGSIDIDPASCEFANGIVQASVYYSLEDDGYSRDWAGNVWINPPYGRHEDEKESNQALWSRRLIEQYASGITRQAVLLVNAVPGNKWFAPLWAFPICFPDHRIRFYNETTEAGQPTHSNALVYLGSRLERFVKEFSEFGPVVRKVEENEFC